MKHLLLICFIIMSFGFVYAQDVITLRTGENIKAKVSEVGISEIRYHKADNLQGPVYITSKSEIAQITYANGTRDIFPVVNLQQQSTQPVTVTNSQQANEPVRKYRRERRYRPYFPYVLLPHLDFGHHIDLGHHGGHHGGHH